MEVLEGKEEKEKKQAQSLDSKGIKSKNKIVENFFIWADLKP